MLKKHFLVKNMRKKEDGKGVAKKNKKVGQEGAKVEKGEGPLKGKLVRVVDEESLYCGSVVEVVGHAKDKLHGHVAWKDATTIFF